MLIKTKQETTTKTESRVLKLFRLERRRWLESRKIGNHYELQSWCRMPHDPVGFRPDYTSSSFIFRRTFKRRHETVAKTPETFHDLLSVGVCDTNKRAPIGVSSQLTSTKTLCEFPLSLWSYGRKDNLTTKVDEKLKTNNFPFQIPRFQFCSGCSRRTEYHFHEDRRKRLGGGFAYVRKDHKLWINFLSGYNNATSLPLLERCKEGQGVRLEGESYNFGKGKIAPEKSILPPISENIDEKTILYQCNLEDDEEALILDPFVQYSTETGEEGERYIVIIRRDGSRKNIPIVEDKFEGNKKEIVEKTVIDEDTGLDGDNNLFADIKEEEPSIDRIVCEETKKLKKLTDLTIVENRPTSGRHTKVNLEDKAGMISTEGKHDEKDESDTNETSKHTRDDKMATKEVINTIDISEEMESVRDLSPICPKEASSSFYLSNYIFKNIINSKSDDNFIDSGCYQRMQSLPNSLSILPTLPTHKIKTRNEETDDESATVKAFSCDNSKWNGNECSGTVGEGNNDDDDDDEDDDKDDDDDGHGDRDDNDHNDIDKMNTNSELMKSLCDGLTKEVIDTGDEKVKSSSTSESMEANISEVSFDRSEIIEKTITCADFPEKVFVEITDELNKTMNMKSSSYDDKKTKKYDQSLLMEAKIREMKRKYAQNLKRNSTTPDSNIGEVSRIDEIVSMADPYDWLSKYCIINPDRLPLYSRQFDKACNSSKVSSTTSSSMTSSSLSSSLPHQAAVPPAVTVDDQKLAKPLKKIGLHPQTPPIKLAIIREPNRLFNPDVVRTGLGKSQLMLENIEFTNQYQLKKLEGLKNHLMELKFIKNKFLEENPEVIKMIEKLKTIKKKKSKGNEKSVKSSKRDEQKNKKKKGKKQKAIIEVDQELIEDLNMLDRKMDYLKDNIDDIKDRVKELNDEETWWKVMKEQDDLENDMEYSEMEHLLADQTGMLEILHPAYNPEINIDQMEIALRSINGQLLTKKEFQYIYHILRILPGETRIDKKMFSVVAALSEKVTQLDLFTRKLINKQDYPALSTKLLKAKELFNLLDVDNDSCSSNSLLIELSAGGVTKAHVQQVLNKLTRLKAGRMTFIDYITYLPLFVEIHANIVDHPLELTAHLFIS